LRSGGFYIVCYAAAIVIVAYGLLGRFPSASIFEISDARLAFEIGIAVIIAIAGLFIKKQHGRIHAESVDGSSKKPIFRFNYVCYGFGIILLLAGTAVAVGAAVGYSENLPHYAPNLSGVSFGLVVDQVTSSSPAEAIGIHQGDVIQYANGSKITSNGDLAPILQRNPGKAVELKWLDTSGKMHSGTFVIPSAIEPGKLILGVNIHSVNTDLSSPTNRLNNIFLGRSIAQATEYFLAAAVLFLAGRAIRNQNSILASKIQSR
jgi:membrane-associated protease RseP (regulator of RpoE activity)